MSRFLIEPLFCRMKFTLSSMLLSCLLFACTEASKKTKTQALSPFDSLSQRIAVELNNHNLLAQRAKLYIDKKDFQSARIDISKAILIDSTVADYYVVLADVSMGLGKPSAAKSALEKCISVNPEHVEGLNKLAEFNLYFKDYKKTIEMADRALKVNVHNPRSYFIKGYAFMESGDTMRAISSMQTAVEQDPDYYIAYVELGLLFAARKDKLAVNYFKLADKLKPNSSEVYYGLAKFHQDMGDIERAEETYRQLLKFDVNNAEAHYNMGYMAFKNRKDYRLAIEHFTKALETNRKMARAAYMRGLCYEALNEPQNAKAQYAFALKLDSSFVDAAKANKRLLGL